MKKETEEKIQSWLQILILPVVVLVVTSWVNAALKSKDVDSMLVQQAIAILSSKDTTDQLILRGWAVDVINSKSDVCFSSEQVEKLKDGSISFPNQHSFKYGAGSEEKRVRYVLQLKDGTYVEEDLNYDEASDRINELKKQLQPVSP
ncbi:hypothetical protein [Pelagicoccus sp. SDUM812003]|uniref:hypothetical protein n=1 Tax=Pelagicoccus sp. SDUM812003 TaxID=3041267 RepID=UPI00280D432F|nr:hypothetical protein [Pelagicoccus sp. SDUM812003]MDQ8202696.1 hypothetical protein [Pelagicoccus sp. SDUM812003]